MKRNIESLFFSEIIFFYGFIMKEKNIILEVLFYSSLVLLTVLIIKKKLSISYSLIGISFSIIALFSFYLQTEKVKSLVPLDQTECLYCQIASSPEKINDSYYSINVKAIALNSICIAGSAKGNLKVIIKSSTLNGSLPGKISQKTEYLENGSYNALPIDKGLCIFFLGKFAEDTATNETSRNQRNTKKQVFFAESFFLEKKDIASKSTSKPYNSKLLELRAFVRYKFKHIFWSFSKAGNLLAALLIGSKDYLDTSMKLLFQKAGLSHVLALSGLHLSVMCVLTEKTADFFKKRKHHLLLMIVSSALFVFIAGGQPSLIRALIFICIKCLCSFFNIKSRKSALFYLSFCIHILVQPAAAFSLQFLLSYSAIYGIFFLSPRILDLIFYIFNFIKQNGNFNKVAELFAVSAGAQLATIPVQLFMLGSFSPIGIISSVIAVPLVSLFVILGVLALILVLVLPESLFFFKIILNFVYNIIVMIVQFFSRL